ncbi:hypothetical protein FSARC_4455 [Fusarium sarcochroum]|uniref:Fungal-type protein kinase domain-containing protein n=1 Tax=Fusarium sarcochroum TaxID=1208366 RepID=A0A8H4U266_9HYPO|nr:hypothetical protein FSARC_4455 [Fusarium sarcochroum]
MTTEQNNTHIHVIEGFFELYIKNTSASHVVHHVAKQQSTYVFQHYSHGKRHVFESGSLDFGITHRFLIPCARKTKLTWADMKVVGIQATHEYAYDTSVQQLVENARSVFTMQPTRVFLHGFIMFGSKMELWLFDRSGFYRSGLHTSAPFDVQESPESLYTVISAYTNMNDIQLGFNHLIFSDHTGSKYLMMGGDGNPTSGKDIPTTTSKLYLDEDPITAPEDIVSRRPVCYKARDEHDNIYVVKLAKKPNGEQTEERLLRLIKDRKVWGVIKLASYQEVKTANLTLSCIVTTPFGRPLKKYGTVAELLGCFCDAIKGHRSLYVQGNLLHQDISEGNIIIRNNCGREPEPRGVLIDLDLAMDLSIGPESPGELKGTKAFMAIGLLRTRILHTYRHDLESFFYVFLWMAVSAHEQLPHGSRLQGWSAGTWAETAVKKTEDMSDPDHFAAIISEFKPDFKRLEGLAYTLREVLFFPDGGDFFLETNMESFDNLYDKMTDAFEKAASG